MARRPVPGVSLGVLSGAGTPCVGFSRGPAVGPPRARASPNAGQSGIAAVEKGLVA